MIVYVVLAHAASTWFLAGLVWTVQVVHYPLFARVGTEGFAAYQGDHSTRIAALLGLPWVVQGATTAVLLLTRPAGIAAWWLVAAAVLAATPVLVTLAVSIPAHRTLGAGFDPRAHDRLVRTNWLRTGAWSVHAAVAAVMVAAVS